MKAVNGPQKPMWIPKRRYRKELLPLAFDLTKSNLEIILKYLKTMLKSIINFNIVKWIQIYFYMRQIKLSLE